MAVFADFSGTFFIKGGRGDWKILETKLRGRKPENKFPAERKLI